MAPLRLPSSCSERRPRRLFILGALRFLSGSLGAALAFGAGAGCGGGPVDKTDLAELPPPPKALIDRAKGQLPPKARPKFGSPPRSKDVNP
jgi:hypothetical protein